MVIVNTAGVTLMQPELKIRLMLYAGRSCV